jgi:hypothetical protein
MSRERRTLTDGEPRCTASTASFERIVMPTITAEVEIEVVEVAATDIRPAQRVRNHESTVAHVKCACTPGLRQPAGITECAYCGAGLH